MVQILKITAKIDHLGKRLDHALAEYFSNYSRSCIKKWILDKKVTINGKLIKKPKKKILGGERITIHAQIEEVCWNNQIISLDILYEDCSIIVINKPCHLVSHPGYSKNYGTVFNALLYYPKIYHVPRAGIVHRLDKNTTGLMVIAKNILEQNRMIQSLQARKMTREYEAIVIGNISEGSTVKEKIIRNSINRTIMAVNPIGKYAVTHYRIIDHFRFSTWLRLRLETGRTHQIRVHMAHINHAIFFDHIYCSSPRYKKGEENTLSNTFHHVNRQYLHAIMIFFSHPINGIRMKLHAPLPKDMVHMINFFTIDTNRI